MAVKAKRVSAFYRDACPTKSAFSRLVSEKTKPLAFLEAAKKALSLREARKDTAGKVRLFLENSYDDVFFAYPWQRKMAIDDDVAKIERFLEAFKDCDIISADRTVYAMIGAEAYETSVTIVRWPSNSFGALVLHPGKSDKSFGGKSVHTNVNTDLHAIVAKLGLEKQYPGIAVSIVYLTNEEDTIGSVGPFLERRTKVSNIYTLTFSDLYEDGAFDFEGLRQKGEEVLRTPLQASCYGCFQKDLCTADTIFTMNRSAAKAPAEKVRRAYVLPKYTERQQEVVDHVGGPMLVCAGPGSGKTAALIGRGVNLIKKGVEPEFILAFTFTDNAATELKERFEATATEPPKCSTIHSFALEILRANEHIVGPVTVMSQYDKVMLATELASQLDGPLAGFSYGSGEEGRNAFLKSLMEKIERYRSDKEGFRKKEKKVDSAFYELAEEYCSIARARGAVTFDEMISRCILLFKAHPEVLEAYSNLYKYVMVDEFQDINAEQAEFIYLLAGHGNIVVVGDDDQNIYGFRGGTNKFMLEFAKTFPGAKTVVFDKNFRSFEPIVEASQRVIGKNGHRIQKEVHSTRKGGVAPVLINGQSPKEVTRAVNEAILAGYKYSDIAILATKNQTLADMIKVVSFPRVLGKAMLTDNAAFRIIVDSLSLYFKGLDDRHMAHFLTVMGLEGLNDVLNCRGGIVDTLYSQGYLVAGEDGKTRVGSEREQDGVAEGLICDSLKVLFGFFEKLDGGMTAGEYTDLVLGHFDMDGSSVGAALDAVIDGKHIGTPKDLLEVLTYMSDFGDDTRLEPDNKGSVLFITSHESKGMEFPVVIMVDDYSTDGTEETNRLYYVAMTRAADRLYILKRQGQQTLYDLLLAA